MYDLLLISPINTQLGRFKRFVPRSVPISIGILAGFLRERELSVIILDEDVVDIGYGIMDSFLKQCKKPRIVGITAMTANVAKGYDIAEMVKAIDRNAIVVFGGIHATVIPDEVLHNQNVDFIVKGEGEYIFLELIHQIKGGRIEPDKLEGIGFKDNGQIVYTKPSMKMIDVNEIPMFPYDMFDPAKYNLGFILTSRGCPFDCIFCSQRAITKRRYRYVASDRVIEELDYLVNNMKQSNITFFDDYFTGHKNRVLELCEKIKGKGLHKKASFFAQSRGDSVDREVLKAMKSANFNCLMLGFETASEDLMQLINKKETVLDNINAVKLAKELGFATEATFIYGFPTETFNDRFKALSLAIDIGIDRARFNNATPYPGTHLYEMVKDKIKKEPRWVNFSSAGAVTAGLRKRYSLPYVPEGCTEKELEGSVLLANLLFYLNFSKLRNLFNPKQSGSGKWFEIPRKELLSPRTLIGLLLLGGTVFLRTIKFILLSSNCRKFFFKGIRK